MVNLIKSNLKLEDDSRDLTISDVIIEAANYCNIQFDALPGNIEPFIRKKVKGIIDYEAANGDGYCGELASIKEGDGTLTFVTGGSNSREGIYGLTESYKADLKRFRRLRGYV